MGQPIGDIIEPAADLQLAPKLSVAGIDLEDWTASAGWRRIVRERMQAEMARRLVDGIGESHAITDAPQVEEIALRVLGKVLPEAGISAAQIQGQTITGSAVNVGSEIIVAAPMTTGQELGREIGGGIGQPRTQFVGVVAASVAAVEHIGRSSLPHYGMDRSQRLPVG